MNIDIICYSNTALWLLSTQSCRLHDPSMDQTDNVFSNHRNFLNQPHGQHRGTGWSASSLAFDFRYVAEAKLSWTDALIRVGPRGQSKFPWVGAQSAMEFPAITPSLLPRHDFSLSMMQYMYLLTAPTSPTASFYRHQIWHHRILISWGRRTKPPRGRYFLLRCHCLIAVNQFMLQAATFTIFRFFFCRWSNTPLMLFCARCQMLSSTSAPQYRYKCFVTFWTCVTANQGLYDGSVRMTPGQEIIFTAKVRMQPVYVRSLLGQYKLSSWNAPVIYVHMHRWAYHVGRVVTKIFFCPFLHIIMIVSTQFIVAYEREAHVQNAIYCAGDCFLHCCLSCLPCLCS